MEYSKEVIMSLRDRVEKKIINDDNDFSEILNLMYDAMDLTGVTVDEIKETNEMLNTAIPVLHWKIEIANKFIEHYNIDPILNVEDEFLRVIKI